MSVAGLKYESSLERLPGSREKRIVSLSDSRLLQIHRELAASPLLLDDLWMPLLDAELLGRNAAQSA